MNRYILMVLVLFSTTVSAQTSPLPAPASGAPTVPPLPKRIVGSWDNNGWQGTVEVHNADHVAKTARATLGSGGDSCGFHNESATIKEWDGKLLVVEIKTRSCFVPIIFRLEHAGGTIWNGTVDNDARTVEVRGARGS